jgi:glycosyltransferase involved in cell wall biosynthesis
MTQISVVIATRNRRDLLAEAIATVFEQSIDDWELIVVDDASTDDTVEFLNTLRDPRLRVVRQTQHGERSVARNRGLAEARGAFIMFLDDDDLLRADTLASLVRHLETHAAAVAAVAACRILQVNGDSVKVFHPSKPHCRVVWPELVFGWWANSGQNLYRTDVVRAVGGYPTRPIPCEDRNMWLAIARRGPVCLVPSVAMEYRQHAGQSKPANIDEIRRGVWRDFIAALPVHEQPRALRFRRAGDLVADAEKLRSTGAFGAALSAQLRACLAAPSLLMSPITGRPLWWGVKKCLRRERAQP